MWNYSASVTRCPIIIFTTEFDKAVSIAQFKGEPLVFTFFFTSCPFPTYCPLLSRHFQDTQEKLLALTNAPAKMAVAFHFLRHGTPDTPAGC